VGRPILSAPGRPAAGVPALPGHSRPVRQGRDAHGRGLVRAYLVEWGHRVRAHYLPKVLPGHEPDRAGVAAARGRHPQPPVLDDTGATRPDVRLVRDSDPLP